MTATSPAADCTTPRNSSSIPVDGSLISPSTAGLNHQGGQPGVKAAFGSSPVDYRRARRDAVFTHRGTLANLSKTYQYILGTWLQTTKAELDDREDSEVYEREVLSFGAPNNEVIIYIPVK